MLLVVEDDPIQRTVLVELLRNAGHRVLEAESRSEALALLDAYAQDIALVIVNYFLTKEHTALVESIRERWPIGWILLLLPPYGLCDIAKKVAIKLAED
jgi:CheY-like chemotaxis protein